jgi:hypothetical protein
MELNGAAQSSAQFDRRSFPFLALPPETRNQIYGLVFEHEDPIYVAAAGWRKGAVGLHRRIGDRNDRLINPGR